MNGVAAVSVCHIVSGDRWAGAEAQISSALRYLATDRRFRLSAVVLNAGRLANELREAGVDVLTVPESEHSFAQICRRTTDFVRQRECHILHSHRYKENLIAAIAGWAAGIRHRVRTQHGMTEPFTGWRALKHSLVQAVDRGVLRNTDRVIAVSTDMETRLRRSAGDRVVLVPNGIDTMRVASTLYHMEAKQRLGLPPRSWLVGYVGRLEPVKRLDIFLRAAKLLSSQVPDACFAIAGDGAEQAAVERMVAELQLQSRVSILGYREDVFDVLRALDVFVLCSDHEGLPMTLLEAMYLRVPVVARAVGGVLDVIENGCHGLLFRSAEPAELAATCLKMRESDHQRLAGCAAQRVVEHFSAQSSAQILAKTYSELIAADQYPLSTVRPSA